jgi:hypothetical protein
MSFVQRAAFFLAETSVCGLSCLLLMQCFLTQKTLHLKHVSRCSAAQTTESDLQTVCSAQNVNRCIAAIGFDKCRAGQSANSRRRLQWPQFAHCVSRKTQRRAKLLFAALNSDVGILAERFRHHSDRYSNHGEPSIQNSIALSCQTRRLSAHMILLAVWDLAASEQGLYA